MIKCRLFSCAAVVLSFVYCVTFRFHKRRRETSSAAQGVCHKVHNFFSLSSSLRQPEQIKFRGKRTLMTLLYYYYIYFFLTWAYIYVNASPVRHATHFWNTSESPWLNHPKKSFLFLIILYSLLLLWVRVLYLESRTELIYKRFD